MSASQSHWTRDRPAVAVMQLLDFAVVRPVAEALPLAASGIVGISPVKALHVIYRLTPLSNQIRASKRFPMLADLVLC
jgi:hypothetical protein